MDRLAKLVAAGFLACGSAHAFVFPSPPPGFGGTPGNWTFAVPSGTQQIGKIAYQSKALNIPVPGANATMSAGYRFAANAPRFAAAAVFASPHLRLALGIAGWLGAAKLVWDEVDKVWKSTEISQGDEPSTGFEYRYGDPFPWRKTQELACGDLAAYYGYTFVRLHEGGINCVLKSWMGDGVYGLRQKRGSACPVGWYVTPAGCVQTPPPKVLTEPEFIDKLAPKPMPETVPWELPFPTPLPVDDPFVNPDPVSNPQHKPKFIPTGDPVPNPNYDPQKAPSPDNQPWLQPGVRVTPSPTPTEPWRVDTTPVNRPQPGPDPVTETPDDPQPGEKPKPEEQQSLCEKHPDILACQKMDEPSDKDLPSSEKTINITPDSGWGADNAACPAPRHLTVQGRDIPIPYDLFCTWAQGLRPVILAMAWLSAAFILLGARNES